MATNMEWLNNGIKVSLSGDPDPEQMPGDWMPVVRHKRPHVAPSQRKGKRVKTRVASEAERVVRAAALGRDPNRNVWTLGSALS